MSLIISENELNSQILEEFEELLQEFIKITPSKFIEIGSLYGWTLQHFIHYGCNNSTAISIDLPVREFISPNDWRVSKQEYNYYNVWPIWAKNKNCKLYLLQGKSQDLEIVNYVKQIIQDHIDFLFIDGDHRYEGIIQDFNLYSKLVRKGGLIAFHDIGKNEEGGGYRAWNQIKSQFKHKEILKSPTGNKGIGILYV
jgi:cephalosporin hydroxylase